MLTFARTYGKADGTLDRSRKHVHPGSEAVAVIQQRLKISGSKRVKRAKMRSAFRPIMTSEAVYTLGWQPLTVDKE